MSWWLTRAGVDHVVLERGVVGQSWRTRRWHSLRLLTPNWMTRLPGTRYDGGDPDGYLARGRGRRPARRLRPLVRRPGAPAHDGRRRAARRSRVPGGHRRRPVAVPGRRRGDGHRRRVADRPRSPATLRGDLQQVTALGYREPGQVAPGEVLVVGASASGVQIADELRRAGRSVTVAVGDHVRVPRTYRGRDIYRWMDELGILDERYDEVEDLVRARRLPSLQLVGTPERRSLDLAALSASGVALTGRFVGVASGRAQFSGLAGEPAQGGRPQAGPPVGPHRRARRRARPEDRSGRPTGRPTPLPAAGDRAGPRPVLRRGLGDRSPAPLPLARPVPARPPGRDPPRGRDARACRACTCSGCPSPADAGPTCSRGSGRTPKRCATHLVEHLGRARSAA